MIMQLLFQFIVSVVVMALMKRFWQKKIYTFISDGWTEISTPIPDIKRDENNWNILITDGRDMETLSKYSKLTYDKDGDSVLSFERTKVTHWRYMPGFPK